MEDAIASIASLVVTRVPSNARPRRRGRAFTFRPNIVSSVCVRACMRACVRACVCVCVCVYVECVYVCVVCLPPSVSHTPVGTVGSPARLSVYPSVRPSVLLRSQARVVASSAARRVECASRRRILSSSVNLFSRVGARARARVKTGRARRRR